MIHALQKIGAVMFLLNTRLSVNEFLFQLKDGEVTHLLFQEGFRSVVDELTVEVDLHSVSFEQFSFEGKVDEGIAEFDLDHVTTVLYTSGTTGLPKRRSAYVRKPLVECEWICLESWTECR